MRTRRLLDGMRLGAVISALLGAGCAAPWDECLVFPTDTIDFGEVQISTTARQTITIENPRTAPRMVIIEPNLPPFGPAAENVLVLLAGGEKTVEFTYFPRDSRLHLGEAVLREEDPACAPKRIPLRGLGGGQMLALEVPEFPPTGLGAAVTRDLVLFSSRRATVTAELNFDATLASPAGTWSGPMSVTLEPSVATRVPITFTPREMGTWLGSVDVIAATARGVPRGEVLRVPLQGIVGKPRLGVSRSAFVLSNVPLGSSFQRRLHLINHGDGRLVVEAPRVTAGSGASSTELQLHDVERVMIEPGQTRALVFDLVPTSLGYQQWSIEFATNDPVQPQFTVLVMAEVKDLETCPLTVFDTQTSPITVTGPYPRTVQLSLYNPNGRACLVTAMDFDGFGSWSIPSLPRDDDSFVIDAQATLTRDVLVNTSGTRFVRWMTWGTGQSEVMISAN